ncbi:MFS transporter [Streptomyces flavofungini]|uniref:MFS transporter n=1 Tax=Streptomyces flavofungini TaxID=68200 RepID=UPI0025B1B77F|nr:MFS transporter [Streptomyces flavofungini]WJV47459.1 MFS transporter [Streptomyces flavofungini]
MKNRPANGIHTRPNDERTRPNDVRTRPLLLRNGDFAKVWAAQVAAQGAFRMLQVGLVWWIVSHVAAERRGLATGLLMVLGTLPAALLVPVVARVLARRTSRTVLRGTTWIAATVAAALALWAALDTVPLAAVYPVALALAVCQAFFDPCIPTSVTALVEADDIENATAVTLATLSMAGLAGAFTAPLLVERTGLTGLVLACAAGYALSGTAAGLARFRPPQDPQDPPAPASAPPKRRLRDILTGLPLLRSILLCLAAVNLFSTAVFVIFPLYTKSVLHADATTFALLEAGLGVGTLLGALSGKYLTGRATSTGALCVTGFALALALPGVVAHQPVVIGCLVVAGWCVGAVGVRFVALFQRAVPAADKPGFFALMQAMIGATFPVASLVFGLLGDHLSPQTLCLIQAVGVLPAACALYALRGREHALTTAPAPSTAPPARTALLEGKA